MNDFLNVSVDDCWTLLSQANLGRLGVVIDGYPHIFPVNYVLDDRTITIRTTPGSKVEAALHKVICFEVDYLARDATSAWSVMVLGSVRHNGIALSQLTHMTSLRDASITSNYKPVILRLDVHKITGRQYVGGELSAFPRSSRARIFSPHGGVPEEPGTARPRLTVLPR